MAVKPIGDRVLIKIKESEDKTAGGIIIPQTAQEKTQTGIVIAVGTDADAIKVKVGDEVMYDKYAGTQVKIEGVEHLIVKMSDILAVLFFAVNTMSSRDKANKAGVFYSFYGGVQEGFRRCLAG